MAGQPPARKGVRLLLVGNGVAQVCALLRYVLLTRLLGAEQLGLAVTLILTAQFFDSISDSGSDRFLIQDQQGDEPRTQGLVHLLAVTKGVLTALGLFVLALPLADFFNEPVLAPALRWLAVVPLITGFFHFDVRRIQRVNQFGPEGLMMLISEVISTLATIGAALWTRNFETALFGLAGRAVAMVIVSHLVAERPYRVVFAREHVERLRSFAAPLMVTGLLLFLVGQGDRLFVGRMLGMADLGRYSAVMLLIFYPSAMLMRYFHSMQLPMIAAAKGVPEMLRRRMDETASAALLLALGMAVGFAVVAPIAAPLLFGSGFRQGAAIIALIGWLQVCRFMRIWPTTSALALGRSATVMTFNFSRLIAFPCAFVGVWAIGGLLGLTLGFALGENLAIGIAVLLTNRAVGLPLAHDLDRASMLAVGCGAIAFTAWLFDNGHLAVAIGAGGATLAVLVAIVWRERAVLKPFLARVTFWRRSLIRTKRA